MLLQCTKYLKNEYYYCFYLSKVYFRQTLKLSDDVFYVWQVYICVYLAFLIIQMDEVLAFSLSFFCHIQSLLYLVLELVQPNQNCGWECLQKAGSALIIYQDLNYIHCVTGMLKWMASRSLSSGICNPCADFIRGSWFWTSRSLDPF